MSKCNISAVRLNGPPCSCVGYNPSGRGLPDLSLAGHAYNIFVGTDDGSLVSGTSASAPAVAALVSLVNGARLAAGLPSVGFLNPALYLSNGSFANDITSGRRLIAVFVIVDFVVLLYPYIII